jgi:hypothetical protein
MIAGEPEWPAASPPRLSGSPEFMGPANKSRDDEDKKEGGGTWLTSAALT